MSWYSDGEKPTKGDLIRSGDWDDETETNYEYITHMSLDDMAWFLHNFVCDGDLVSVEEIKKWLRRDK
jgi:hypothetical protein